MKNDIFYNFNKTLSYNALLNFIVGERGVGKSFGAKVHVTDRFLNKGKQFCYIRRFKTELNKSMLKNGNPIFFDQIKNIEKYKNHKLTNKSDTFLIDNKIAGFAMPLSTASMLKSSTYENVDTIIFDEFLIDKGCYHYLPDEVTSLLDLIETISRLRNVRVFFLGNAISISNPYFDFFNISLPYNSEYKICKKSSSGRPLILINYIKNLKYREVKKQSDFGQLIAGTSYGKYAIDNQFLRDNKSFIEKKSQNCHFYFTVLLNSQVFGAWIDYKNEKIYISNDYDPNCPTIFTFNFKDHNERTQFIKCRTSLFFKTLIDYYRFGKLCFESQKIKNIFLPYIQKLCY